MFPPGDYPPAVPTLLAHVDDEVFLPQELQDATFEQRTQSLYLNWRVLHGVNAVHDIKRWLESLSKEDHLLLVHLYAAYWVTAPVVTLSFGHAKAKFWDAVNHAGAFVNGLFVITHDVPLVSVTVESLLVRTVSQWVQFLSRHSLTVANFWDVSLGDVIGFAALESTVHPQYNVLIAALIDMVNYCSDAYRHDLSIEFLLHRHLYSSQTTRLNLTAVDANTLLSAYFPTLYDVGDLRVSDGLHLLRRAQVFVLSSPTPHQYTSECNERWLHLLACMFLPSDVDVTILTTQAKVTALVSQRPPSYTNATLRTTYPSLLQQPGCILKEFLDTNEMALNLYGTALTSDSYGVLHLKLMGCLVAIVQDQYAVENVDRQLSRSDIYYIAHVGGFLASPQRRFIFSDIFIVFDLVDVNSQLDILFNSKMSVLIAPPPRQPQKLSSAEIWSNEFKSKLPDTAAQDQAARTLSLLISTVVTVSPPFSTVRPQFVRLPRHDEAMVQPASSSDYVRQLASSVRVRYIRMRPTHHVSALQLNSSSTANRSSSALFNFPPPQEGARFGTITAQYDEWSEYIEPVAYSLQGQQRIVNWNTVRNLTFSGEGLTYMQCLRLFHTSDRPIVLGDNLVFLYCPQCVFTPENPGRTLFSATHVLYTVVNIHNSVFYLDRLEILCNYVVMEPLFMKIACPYLGTYILFSQVHDGLQPGATLPSSTTSSQLQSDSAQQRSIQSAVLPSSVQQRPSANASSSSRSAAAGHGSHRAAPNDSSFAVQPVDYDSNDSQVKKKTKVAALDYNRQTFYVTGKESALHILRDTYSVRSLMEDGQLQLLVHHVGDFVNNYTADVFKTGIIRRHSKADLLAGMNLTMHGNHDLDRF